MVPYWDYDLPADEPHLWDSSAGAIAASGLWDLSESVIDAEEEARYQAAALTALQTLCSDEFLPQRQAGVGGHSDARHLSLSQGPRRGRVGGVG